jgi:hypothetical protein
MVILARVFSYVRFLMCPKACCCDNIVVLFCVVAKRTYSSLAWTSCEIEGKGTVQKADLEVNSTQVVFFVERRRRRVSIISYSLSTTCRFQKAFSSRRHHHEMVQDVQFFCSSSGAISTRFGYHSRKAATTSSKQLFKSAFTKTRSKFPACWLYIHIKFKKGGVKSTRNTNKKLFVSQRVWLFSFHFSSTRHPIYI